MNNLLLAAIATGCLIGSLLGMFAGVMWLRWELRNRDTKTRIKKYNEG